MKKQSLGNLVIILLVLINFGLWFAFPPEGLPDTPYALEMTGEMLASTAIVLMAIALLLAARLRFLEPYFGGLDQMYQAHKQAAMLAFLLLVLHFFLIPDSGQMGVGKPLGMLSFVGIILLVILSIAPRVPLISRVIRLGYDKWRVSHKLIGLFFIIGLVHFFLVGTMAKQTIPGTYMMIFGLIGVVAYIYKLFGAARQRPLHDYTVSAVRMLNGTAVEITLEPQGEAVDFNAGQFLFVYFPDDKILAEPHPCTISSAPGDENVRLSIKASGDWTRYLVENLQTGAVAKLDGCYGMFNYKTGGNEQVWIAGGIGVTPFLSWVRDANGGLETDVDFFYSVTSPEEALFLDEFVQADEADDKFRAHVRYSALDGYLSAQGVADESQGDIIQKDIYLCGPIKMTEGFSRQFRKLGVPSGKIHYEEFNFR